MKFTLKKKALKFRIKVKTVHTEPLGIYCRSCKADGITAGVMSNVGLICYGCAEEARNRGYERRKEGNSASERKAAKKNKGVDAVIAGKKPVIKFKLKRSK
jgi:uncharacterized membrane protein